jgi:hypothetical protein
MEILQLYLPMSFLRPQSFRTSPTPSTDLNRHLLSASLAELNCIQHCQNSVLSYNHFARTK